MTTLESRELIGKIGTIHHVPYLAFDVYIRDVKFAYGDEIYLVQPVSGVGTHWVKGVKNIRETALNS